MAIVGKGDIASVLPDDRPGWLWFASGVSNSQETRESEYQREIELMRAQDRSYHFVYFSSLSVFYSDTRYAEHKRAMEVMVRAHFSSFTIVRLGNISWGSNPHTLLNYFRNCIRDKVGYVIQPVERYVVDEAEFLHWINLLPEFNCEVNIPGRRMMVADIVRELLAEEKRCKITA